MADQLTGLVQKMQAEGVPEADILAFVNKFDTANTPVSSPAPAAGIATGGGRGTGLDVRKSNQWAQDNAPSIGAGIAALATGGSSIPASMLAAAAGGAAGSGLRGDSVDTAAWEGTKQGLLTAAGGAVGKGLAGAGKWVASKSDPLIQSAIKPAIAELRRAAGSAGTSMQAEAKRISGIVRRTGVRTPEQAEAGIRVAEQRVQDALESVGPDAENLTVLTDAPQRAGRYLDKLGRSASRQMSPGDDVATVASERAAFERSSPLFQTVKTPAVVSHELTTSAGAPLQTASEITRRVPRANVTAGESMELARGTTRHATRKAYGEQRGMSVEAQKALDRAGRDAAKAAAPESMKADLKAQGELIRLKPILDRMMLREGSRDVMSLPGLVGAAPALAQGKMPLLGMAAQWMRNNQLRAGVGADKIGRAVASHGEQTGQMSADTIRLLDMLFSEGAGQ